MPSSPADSEPLLPGDFYVENGRVVFTAQYLLRRGTCCESGCRHCPYVAPDARRRGESSPDGETKSGAR